MKKYCLVLCLLLAALPAQAFDVIWDRSGVTDSSHYGYRILPLDDQNDDGFADWAVWAGGTIFGGTVNGMVEFFHGGNPPSTIPYMTIHGRLASWGAANTLDDINNDGYTDWFVKYRTDSSGFNRIGIFLGGPNADTLPEQSLVISGPDYFGTIGDFNGDGYSDMYWYHYREDYVDVFWGRDTINLIVNWTRHSPQGDALQVLPNGYGDLNGDGYSDFVSETYYSTYIFLGGMNPDTVPAYTWHDIEQWPLNIVNDLNGDPFDELVYYNGHIHLGNPVMSSSPNVLLYFPCSNGIAERAVGLGDINRDGFTDMALINGRCDDATEGVLSLYLGHPWLNPQPARTIWGGDWQDLISIQTAAGLGDVNGDGVDDWAIGAWDDTWYLGWRGRCIVIKGDTTLIARADDPFIPRPSCFILSAYPNPFNAQTTFSYSLPSMMPVSLCLYDILGRRVAVLTEGVQTAGLHKLHYNGSTIASGTYIIRLEAGAMSAVQKAVLLK